MQSPARLSNILKSPAIDIRAQDLDWKQAAGTCGFNTNGSVETSYLNGVALFAFENLMSTPEDPLFTCVVAGRIACGGSTMEAVKSKGEAFAMIPGGKSLTRDKFDEVIANPYRPAYTGVNKWEHRMSMRSMPSAPKPGVL